MSVAGHSWHRSVQEHYAALGLEVSFNPCREQFRFGDGGRARSTRAVLYPVCFDGRVWHILWVAEVSQPCPGLLSAKAMAQTNCEIHFSRAEIEIVCNGTALPLFEETGHPDLALVRNSADLSQAPVFQLGRSFI